MGKVLEILKNDSLKKIFEQVNEYCSYALKDYLNDISQFSKKNILSPCNIKNFYDSVWGTIEINQGEILILDSPLIQRLRHIKQLGLVHLLYASADYSRFSHTLGVIHTSDMMQHQIERDLIRRGITNDEDVNQIVRLAAIFHDVGHMFCSHASERFFQNNNDFCLFKEIEAIQKQFNNQLSIKPSLAELLSVFIVTSESVGELLELVKDGLKGLKIQKSNKNIVIEKICCLILGYPYSEKMLPYSQIISGQIDADKIDYLKRDSHSTGVPAAVDMSRIFQKLSVVESNEKFSMKSTNEEDVDKRYTIAIAPAAINTIDQLVISRYMMFENVYFHQKTLTAETLLRHSLHGICKSTEGLLDNFRNIFLLLDNDVISDDFDSNAKSKIKEFIIKDEELYNKSCKILKYLANRKLYKRCVAFTKENLVDVGHKGYDFYRKVFVDNNIKEQKKFIDLVKEKIDRCKENLSETDYKSSCETEVLFVIPPSIPQINSNIAIAGKSNIYRDKVFESDNWLKSRSVGKPQNYLVTTSDDRYISYIATEYVLFVNYGLIITDPVIYDNDEIKRIEKIKGVLGNNGFYNNVFAIAYNSEIGRHNRDIENLVKNRWRNYELVSLENNNNYWIDEHRLQTFIKQFYMFEKEIGCFSTFVTECIEMLKKVNLVSQNMIFESLKSNITKVIKEEKTSIDNIAVCNLGNLQDSSAQISYLFNKVNNVFNSQITVRDLDKVLTNCGDGKVIMLIDDAFYSGKQIISIFESYMGKPIAQRETQEIHVEELSEENKEKLKRSKLYFSFLMYNKNNEDNFIKKMGEIGIKNIKIVSDKGFSVKFFEDSQSEGKLVLKKYFEKAGELLLQSKAIGDNGRYKENWNCTRIKESALGYNDAQQLVVYPWNTPTYTLTALWAQGRINDYDWVPLFPRTDK